LWKLGHVFIGGLFFTENEVVHCLYQLFICEIVEKLQQYLVLGTQNLYAFLFVFAHQNGLEMAQQDLVEKVVAELLNED
jgi:hypothetical protein